MGLFGILIVNISEFISNARLHILAPPPLLDPINFEHNSHT